MINNLLICAIIGFEGNNISEFIYNETNETQSLTPQHWYNAELVRSAFWGLFRGPFNQFAVVCITQFTMRRCAAPIIPNCHYGLRRRAIKSFAIEMRRGIQARTIIIA